MTALIIGLWNHSKNVLTRFLRYIGAFVSLYNFPLKAPGRFRGRFQKKKERKKPGTL